MYFVLSLLLDHVPSIISSIVKLCNSSPCLLDVCPIIYHLLFSEYLSTFVFILSSSRCLNLFSFESYLFFEFFSNTTFKEFLTYHFLFYLLSMYFTAILQSLFVVFVTPSTFHFHILFSLTNYYF